VRRSPAVHKRGSQRAHGSLCKAIRDLLRLHGIPCWRVGQKGSQRRDGSWYAGHDKGAPDIFGILPANGGGKALAIEVKSGARATLTAEQKMAKIECEGAGGVWITAKSVDQVADELGLGRA